MRRGKSSLIAIAALLIVTAMMPMAAYSAQNPAQAPGSDMPIDVSGGDGGWTPVEPLGGDTGGERPGVNSGDDDAPGETIVQNSPTQGELELPTDYRAMMAIWLQITTWTLF